MKLKDILHLKEIELTVIEKRTYCQSLNTFLVQIELHDDYNSANRKYSF